MNIDSIEITLTKLKKHDARTKVHKIWALPAELSRNFARKCEIFGGGTKINGL